MSKSREQFMREMGISCDDVMDPQTSSVPVRSSSSSRSFEQSASKATPSSYRSNPSYEETPQPKRSYDSGSMSQPQQTKRAMESSPVVPSSKKASFATPSSAPRDSAKEDFLRSLGIDNLHDESVTSPTMNATGSQEIPKTRVQGKENYSPSKNARRATTSFDDEFDQTDSGDDSSYANHGAKKQSSSSSFTSSRSQNSSAIFNESAKDLTLGAVKKVVPPSTPQLDSEASTLDNGATAEDFKNLGNKYFEAAEYRKAIRQYTKAIEKDPTNAAFYSNRSAAYLQGAKQMGIDTRNMALRDADKVIELRQTWFKGYSRRGDALFKLERYAEAAEAYQNALELDPENGNIMHSLGECRNLLGDIKHTGSWQSDLSTSSASYSSAPKGSTRSAHQMLNEFKRETERTNPSTLIGNDFREAELEKFRMERQASTSSMSSNKASRVPSTTSTPTLNDIHIPQELSSNAAAQYQKSLLEEYRKKKGGK